MQHVKKFINKKVYNNKKYSRPYYKIHPVILGLKNDFEWKFKVNFFDIVKNLYNSGVNLMSKEAISIFNKYYELCFSEYKRKAVDLMDQERVKDLLLLRTGLLAKAEFFEKNLKLVGRDKKWFDFVKQYSSVSSSFRLTDAELFAKRLHVRFGLNNIYLTLSNKFGQPVLTVTSGVLGYKGKEKKSTNAVYSLGRASVTRCFGLNWRRIIIYITFVRRLSTTVLKSLLKGVLFNRIRIVAMRPYVKICHNGMRKKKQRRK